MDEGDRLKSVWLNVRGFPKKLWQYHEFEKLVEDFGVLLDVDNRTRGHYVFTEARLRVGVCDISAIPKRVCILYRNERNEWRKYEVEFHIDGGVTGNTGTKRFQPYWQKKRGPGDEGVGSHNSDNRENTGGDNPKKARN
jgi:hypothetical protein